MPVGYKRQNKRCPFALQKGIFYTSKGHVLQCKRAPFTTQKSIVSKQVVILFYINHVVSRSCLSTFGLKSTDLYLVRVLFFLACYGYFPLFLIIIFCLSGCRRCLNLIQFVLFSDVTLPVSNDECC